MKNNVIKIKYHIKYCKNKITLKYNGKTMS